MLNPRPTFAPLTLALALAFACSLGPSAVHAQSAPVPMNLSLPAQPLGAALNELARQARLQLMVPPALVAGKNAPAVNGSLTVRQALDRLLAGSGLMADVNGSEVVVRRAPPAQSANDPTLSTVVVTEQAERSASTESTGSYAARGATIGKSTLALREIPQSISVLSRQQMDDASLTTLDDAMKYMTGLSPSGYGNHTAGFAGTTLVSRGYALSSQQDGVPIQFGENHDLALYDRVEVLRGPTGLLQGNGEPGGAINYILKRPKANGAVDVFGSVGSWNRKRVGLDATGSLNEARTLRGRAVVVQSDQDAFYDKGRQNALTAYAALEYDITPRTTLGVSLMRAEREGVNFWGFPLYANDRPIERRSAFVGLDRESVTDKDQIQADLRHLFDSGWELKASVLHNKADYGGFGAFGTTRVDPATGRGGLSVGRIETVNENNAVDVNLSGPLSFWGRTHTFLAGYNRSSYDYLGGSRYTAFANVDVFNTHDFAIAETITSKSQTKTVQSGLYSTARLKLADPVTLVLGGRWSDYDSKSRTVAATTSTWTTSRAAANGEFTPYGGLVWDLNKQVSLYASYVDTFVPQTQVDAAGQVLDPRTGWQVEAGAKGEFFDGKLNASIAVFRIRDTNRSMIDTANVGCGGTPLGVCYRAAGLVQSQGWEFELSGSPAPGWDISAGYSHTRATFLRDSVAANVGQRFGSSTTPRHLFKLWTNHRFDQRGALAGWSVGAGLQAQSDIVSGNLRQGGHAEVAAKVGYRFNPRWEATLTVNNLFDRHYLQAVGANHFNIYGDPRNWMLAVRGSF